MSTRTTNKDGSAEIVSMHLFAEKRSVTTCDVPLIRFVLHDDPTESQMLRLIETSGALDFWADESEDCYGANDGEAL